MRTRTPQESAGPQKPAEGDGAGNGSGRKPHSLDLEDELDVPDERTSRDTGWRDDEGFVPEDDSDLELASEEDGEPSALDTPMGFEDETEDELESTGEGVSWTHDSESGTDDLPGMEADDDLIGGSEYGWIGEDDAPLESSDDDDFGAGLDDETSSGHEDDGAEGLDDDTDLEDLDIGALPKLEADTDDDTDALTADAIEDMIGVRLDDEHAIEVAGRRLLTLPEYSVRCLRLAELASPAQQLHQRGSTLMLAADQLYRIEDAVLSALRLGASAQTARGLTTAEHEGRVLLAAVTEAGLHVSTDGGRRFALRAAGSDVPVQVGFTVSTRGARLWGVLGNGMLAYSESDSDPACEVGLDGNVLALATDGERRVCVLVQAADGRLRLSRSRDGGRRFAWDDLPSDVSLDPTQLRGLLLCRDAVLLADASHVVVSEQGTTWNEIADGAHWPAALVDEDDEVFAYVCVPHEERILIVRRAARASATALVVGSLDRRDTGELRGLVATQTEGLISVHVASERALYRIEASLDGEHLA